MQTTSDSPCTRLISGEATASAVPTPASEWKVAPTIRFIVPWFGQWPRWFDAYLLTCSHNPEIEWLFLSDAAPPKEVPPNCRFVPMTMHMLNSRAQEVLNCPVRKEAYSQCDLRPAYGRLFADELQGADFWGHCDIDVVWGRLSTVFTVETLVHFDVITSRRSQIAGHCTIYRNTERINTLYEHIPGYRDALASSDLCRMNESHMGQLLRKSRDVKVYWHAQHSADARELDRRPHGWRWEQGHILDSDSVERSCLHFMHWKNSIQDVDFRIGDNVRRFSITWRALRNGDPTLLDLVLDRMPVPSRIYRRWRNAIRLALTGRGRF